MSDILQGFRQALQDLIAPKIRELRGEIKSLRTEMKAGFEHLQLTMQNAVLRADKENWRDIAELRERVTRLEDQRALQQ